MAGGGFAGGFPQGPGRYGQGLLVIYGLTGEFHGGLLLGKIEYIRSIAGLCADTI